MRRVLTVGHSTRSAAEFVQLLHAHGVRTVADVRRFPGSRRHPQFGRDALEHALAREGIAYRHLPGLGGRRDPAPDSPNGAWRVAGFRGYADHMDSAEFRDSLEELLGLARAGAVVVMCAEAVPWRCHRRLLADALVARGIEVRHVLGPERADRHELHPAARVLEGGRLVYPGPGAEQVDLLE